MRRDLAYALWIIVVAVVWVEALERGRGRRGGRFLRGIEITSTTPA